jgi:hypothetical protein
MFRSIVLTSFIAAVAALAIASGASARGECGFYIQAACESPPAAASACLSATPNATAMAQVCGTSADAVAACLNAFPHSKAEAGACVSSDLAVPPIPKVAAVSSPGTGFDWGSAGIGAGIGIALLGGALASGSILGHRRRTVLHA